jgi:hypothetical protein
LGLDSGKGPDELISGWEAGRVAFAKTRAKYLIY